MGLRDSVAEKLGNALRRCGRALAAKNQRRGVITSYSIHYTKLYDIMIDEFQDNNEEQKELLYLLAERADSCTPGVPGPEAP